MTSDKTEAQPLRSGWEAVKTATLRVLALPAARYHRAAAEDARRRSDWSALVRHVSALHNFHWQSDDSWFLLGSAYGKLNRHEEAVEALGSIQSTLRRPECEQERWLNLAVSLYHAGKPCEALALLPEEDLRRRFPDYAEQAAQLRAFIQSSLAKG